MQTRVDGPDMGRIEVPCLRNLREDKEATMAQRIPDKFLDLFRQPAFAHLATVMPDGTPQVTPVWCDFDGTYLIVNSAKGRVKDRNMIRNPSVALSVMDPKNPYRYLAVRGKVAQITEEGADQHIDRMAKKYLNLEKYPNRRPGEVRVMYKILPEKISTMG
jgi:PPOX class probable F420-dependent enzyme